MAEKAPQRVDTIKHGTKAGDDYLGTGIRQLRQGDEQGGVFNQGPNGRRVARALDQVAFPVSRDERFFDLGRPIMNARPVGNRAAAILPARTGTTGLARLTQAGNQLAAQFAARHGVECRVDGFMADLKRGFMRMPPSRDKRRQHGDDHAGSVSGFVQPLRFNLRLIVLGGRGTRRAIARSVPPCSSPNWIPQALVKDAPKKVFPILDNQRAHPRKPVKAYPSRHLGKESQGRGRPIMEKGARLVESLGGRVEWLKDH